jgi:hypothetical protein
VTTIDTIVKTEEKTEKNGIQKENSSINNSISILHTLNNIDPEKIDCKEESKDEPFSCNVCARKFTRHTFMINHRYSIYIRTVSFKLLFSFGILNSFWSLVYSACCSAQMAHKPVKTRSAKLSKGAKSLLT